MHINTTKDRIFGLDLMRAMAITLAVFGHCLWIYTNTTGIAADIFQVSAFMGVETFFVLSGFLIGSILYRSYVDADFNWNGVIYFLKRRWFRTLPAYYLVLLINIGITAVYGPKGNFWPYFMFQQNFNSPMLPFFPESWSLGVEEVCYISLPLMLWMINMIFKPKNRSLFFLISVLILIAFALFEKLQFHMATHNTDIGVWNSALKPVVIYRLDAIFIGVFCSWIALSFPTFWMRYKKLFCSLGFVLFGLLFVGIGFFRILIETHPFFWNVLYLPIVSMAVACFLPILSEWKSWHSRLSKPITTISVISYSIYLLHYSIILQLMKNNIIINADKSTELHLFTAAYIIITLAASYFMYRFYEKPIMDLRDKN